MNLFKKIRELGISKFLVIWSGQSVSIIGSTMTGFAMNFWLWDATGNATEMVFNVFLRAMAIIILTPFAGSIVDRFNRKTVVMISDSGAALASALFLFLIATKSLTITQVYVIGLFQTIFGMFHSLATTTMITQIVPNKQLGRISGIQGFSSAFAGVVAPVLAGSLISIIGYEGILVIDLATFIFAFVSIAVVKVPSIEPAIKPHKNIFKDTSVGFKFLLKNKTLLMIVINSTIMSFFFTFGSLVVNPMILAKSGSDKLIVGIVRSWWGIAGIIGSLILMFWGGPKRRFLGSSLFMLGFSIGLMIIGIGNNVVFWIIGGFVWVVCGSLGDVRTAFYSSKIPAEIQGRVFGAKLMASNVLSPISYGFAGILADKVFEPMMRIPSISSKFSWLVGTGKGSGMGLMIVVAGLLSLIAMIPIFINKNIRNADTLLPDVNDRLVPESESMITANQDVEGSISENLDGNV